MGFTTPSPSPSKERGTPGVRLINYPPPPLVRGREAVPLFEGVPPLQQTKKGGPGITPVPLIIY